MWHHCRRRQAGQRSQCWWRRKGNHADPNASHSPTSINETRVRTLQVEHSMTTVPVRRGVPENSAVLPSLRVPAEVRSGAAATSDPNSAPLPVGFSGRPLTAGARRGSQRGRGRRRQPVSAARARAQSGSSPAPQRRAPIWAPEAAVPPGRGPRAPKPVSAGRAVYALSYIVATTPATLSRGLVKLRTSATVSSSWPTPRLDSVSHCRGISTSSAAVNPSMVRIPSDGGQSMSTTS